MSIVTLKKKTQAKYKNMSVSQPQFSLNGTLRNQGYIGQTSSSRNLVKTPMLGNTAKGHGGLNGAYKQSPIVVESSLFTTNDPLSIKPSVGHVAGDIAVQNRFLSCREWPCSQPVVKNLLYSSDDYTAELRKKTLKCEVFIPSSTYGLNLVKNGNMDSPDIIDVSGSQAATYWSQSGGLIDMYVINSPYSNLGLPSNITQAAIVNGGTTVTSLNQNISFLNPGNYVLAFWTTANYGMNFNSNNKIQVSIGTSANQMIDYPASFNGWVQYRFLFNINSTQLNQTLSFTSFNYTGVNSGNTNHWITGVSIYSIDKPCCALSDTGLPSLMFSKTKTNTVTKVLTNMNGSIKYNASYADYLARIDNACDRKTKLVSDMNRGPNF